MKTNIIVSLIFLTIYSGCFAQTPESDVVLKKIDGEYNLLYRGRQFKVNENVLTVKPIQDSLFNKNLNVIRKNQLGYYDIKIPSQSNIEDYRNKLLKTGLFESVDYNSYYEYQSLLINDYHAVQQWYLSTINVFDAWDFTTGDPSIVVAVIDNGVNWEHPDLGSGYGDYHNVYLNQAEDDWDMENYPETGNGLDDDNNGYEYNVPQN